MFSRNLTGNGTFFQECGEKEEGSKKMIFDGESSTCTHRQAHTNFQYQNASLTPSSLLLYSLPDYQRHGSKARPLALRSVNPNKPRSTYIPFRKNTHVNNEETHEVAGTNHETQHKLPRLVRLGGLERGERRTCPEQLPSVCPTDEIAFSTVRCPPNEGHEF